MSHGSQARGERALFWGFTLAALGLYLVSPVNELGDSYHYALAIESGKSGSLIEASHLLWRPFGWWLWTLARLLGWSAGAFAPLRMTAILGSALGVGVAAVWLDRRIGGVPALFAAALFAVGHAWWSYSTSACSYTSSVTLSLGALTLAWPEPDRPTTMRALVGAMLLQSLAMLAWQPAFLSSAGMVLAASLRRERGRTVIVPAAGLAVAAGMAAMVGAAYFYVWFRHVSGGALTLGGWLASGRHGQHTELSLLNVARAGYGWTRIFLQPSRLGLDPAGHGWTRLVSTRTLFEWGMARTVLVYLVAAAALAGLLRKPRGGNRITWALLAAWMVPHILFGVLFKGIDLERWIHVWPGVLAALLLAGLGNTPGRWRARAVCGGLALLLCLAVVYRFGPDGSLENRPPMRLLRETGPHLRPGDMVYLGGELDEGQLNRTTQTAWLFSWVYLDRAAALDVWTSVKMVEHARFELGYLVEVRGPGREFISERVLAGIQPGDLHGSGAEELRSSLVRRLPPGDLRSAFVADGEQFFQLLPEPGR